MYFDSVLFTQKLSFNGKRKDSHFKRNQRQNGGRFEEHHCESSFLMSFVSIMNTLLLLTVKKNRGWLGLAHSNEFISLQSARRIFVKEYNNAISIHRPKGMAKDMEERSAKLVDLAEIRWLRITRHVTDTFDLFLFTCGKVSPYFFYILCVYVCGCRPHSIPHSLFHLDWSTPLCRTLLPLFKCDHNIQNSIIPTLLHQFNLVFVIWLQQFHSIDYLCWLNNGGMAVGNGNIFLFRECERGFVFE